MDFSDLTLTAIEAASLAGDYLRKNFGSCHTIRSKEGKQNLVTECDTHSEEMILSFIRKRFKHHGFLGEESGNDNLLAEVVWVIDPLDGTMNFAKQIPHFSVSIAACRGSEVLSGVVVHPLLQEMFVAEKGKGAFFNKTPIKVSSINTLDHALLASGFPYNVDKNPLQCIDAFSYFLHQGSPIRRLGSAALDLAYTASGRFDAYFETQLHPWDVAAGILLVQEAGGRISTWEGKPHPILEKSDILASNSYLHPTMISSIRKGRNQ